MEKHVKEILVFRGKKVSRGQDIWFYMKGSGSSYTSNWAVDPLEGKDFNEESPSAIVRALESLAKASSEQYDDVELVRMKITTVVESVDINEGEILEERRRQALAKLNTMEIEALGIESLAAYNKVKFHGSSS